MISFQVEDASGTRRLIEVPEGINLNVMEVLCASDYGIPATCGGMALCATCYVEVAEGLNQLDEPGAAELDMLDTLPSANSESRLSCQIKVSPKLQGILLKLK